MKCLFWCSNMSRLQSLVFCGLAVSMGEAAKPILVQGVKASCNVVLRGRRGTSCHSHVSANVSIIILWQAQYFRVGSRRWVAFFVADTALWRPPSSFGVAGADPSCVECYFSWQAQFLLHSLHFTLYTLHSALYTFTLHTPHSRLYTLHFTLHPLHCTLHTTHSTLYTPHFTLLHSAL